MDDPSVVTHPESSKLPANGVGGAPSMAGMVDEVRMEGGQKLLVDSRRSRLVASEEWRWNRFRPISVASMDSA